MSASPDRLAPLWTLIIPVKDTWTAKTRLAHLDQGARASLAVAFALDAAGAALGCPEVGRVVAVTNDPTASTALSSLRVEVLADEPRAGLNAALRFAASVVRRQEPGAPVAAMSADLPALRSGELSVAFEAAAGLPLWFVPDAERLGTTLLAAVAPCALAPAFGASSRTKHLASGAAELEVPGLAGLRRDVDTQLHLAEALRLGVGAHTADALERLDAA